MASVLKVDTLQKPDGSTPTAADLGLDVAGSVVQVAYGTASTQVINSTNSPVDTGLSVTITPKFNNSMIIILFNHSDSRVSASGIDWDVRVMRNGTVISTHDKYFLWNDSNLHGNVSLQIFDQPNTTSAVTYSTQMWKSNGTGNVYAQADGQQSQVTALEIAQ